MKLQDLQKTAKGSTKVETANAAGWYDKYDASKHVVVSMDCWTEDDYDMDSFADKEFARVRAVGKSMGYTEIDSFEEVDDGEFKGMIVFKK